MTERVNSGENSGLEQGFLLGAVQIEPSTGEISGPGGRGKLDLKVMDVLVFMAQHAGQVVAREALLAKLWPGAIVTDDALTRCFYELRRQLGAVGGSEEYRAAIETLPKRGYRLNGAVTAVPASSVRRNTGLRRRLLPVLVIAAAAILLVVLGRLFFMPDAVPPRAARRGFESLHRSSAVCRHE